MAKKFVETEVETKTKTVQKKRFDDLNKEAYDAAFNNFHSTKDYENVLDEIETQALKSFEEGEFVEENTESENQEQENLFWDKNSIQKLRQKKSFNQVAQTSEIPDAKIEIKQEISVSKTKKAVPQTKRKKLWLITGAVCIVLFFAIFCYNMISINSLAKKIPSLEEKIKEQQKVLDGKTNNHSQILLHF